MTEEERLRNALSGAANDLLWTSSFYISTKAERDDVLMVLECVRETLQDIRESLLSVLSSSAPYEPEYPEDDQRSSP